MTIPWKVLVPYLVKYIPRLVEAVITDRTARRITVKTEDGRTVRVIELKSQK